MNNELGIVSFLEKAKHLPVIDVRSPGEFDYGHIPNAINVPLFNNEERAKVGTLYKQSGKERAIEEGYKIVNPKLEHFIKESKRVANSNEVLVHCWRGGMRSANFASHLNQNGIKSSVLEKGYKTYRNHVLDFFSTPVILLVLGGETGSGKTEILKHLSEAGEQVIDLEKLAHHKGSSFGALGETKQPTVEQFENNLFEEWRKLDFSKRIWVEDEAKSIGRVFLPNNLWEKMKTASIIRIKIPKEERVKKLVQDYGNFPIEDLEAAVVRIEKRLGGESFKNALEALKKNNLSKVAELTLYYYDKAYNYNHEKIKFENVHFVEAKTTEAKENSALLLNFANKKFNSLQKI